MSDHDRFLSYVTESLNNLHHYVNYRGRSYEDLTNLQKAVDDLKSAINLRLVRDFKDLPEMAELLKIED